MVGLATHEREYLIERFFDWFAARLKNARQLYEASPTRPEASLVLGAGLDAMAKFWAQTFRPELAKGGVPAGHRFSTFLRELAGHAAFDRVSVPMLLTKLKPKFQIEADMLREHFRFREDSNILRTWEDDPVEGEVTKILESRVRDTTREAVSRLVAKSLLGQIVYTEFRCCYVHEVQLSRELDFGQEHPDRVEPWYRNMISTGDKPDVSEHYKRLILPWGFLAASYERSLNSFEQLCRDSETPPAPMLEGL
ncbi:MAG: hypothetical protein RLP09_20580 [Sandaracinaceae bacterium]